MEEQEAGSRLPENHPPASTQPAESPPDTAASGSLRSNALRLRRRRPQHIWKFGQAFWTVASLISLVVNVILLVALLGLGRQLFTLKGVIQEQVLGGLYKNFILMDQAHIQTTIPVSTQVQAKFDLPLKTNTVVVLTEETTLANARVARLTTGGLSIENAPATIVLPAGTRLPVALDLSVPVDQMIPVSLDVNVDIPLNQTELHEPFVGLQEVVRPYYRMLSEMPDSWSEMMCSDQPTALCNLIFGPTP